MRYAMCVLTLSYTGYVMFDANNKSRETLEKQFRGARHVTINVARPTL